jgi:DNA-binding IclR family transcriptional regulator
MANSVGETRSKREPLIKAFQIIAWMTEMGKASYGVREISSGLDLPPSTVHRTLTMLEEAEVLAIDRTDGRYRFSLAYFRLACRLAASRFAVYDVALPACRRLAARSNESVYMGLYDAPTRSFVYLEHIPSSNPVNYVMAKYESHSLYPGAGGVAILAFLPWSEIDEVLGDLPLREVTDRTVTDPVAIREELERIRARGYVVSAGQRIKGGCGIGAPVFGIDGKVFGNIVVALPEERLLICDVGELGGWVKDAAREVSEALAGTEEPK